MFRHCRVWRSTEPAPVRPTEHFGTMEESLRHRWGWVGNLIYFAVVCCCWTYKAPPSSSLWMQEDATGTLRGVLLKDVITAWHTYMSWLYLIGGIRCPTKVYFTLSTLAGDSRYHSNLSWAKSSEFVYEYIYFFLNSIISKGNTMQGILTNPNLQTSSKY